MVSNEPARLAAYTDLVAALLDLREPAPTVEFDRALDAALASGALTPETARHLRWLQRETVHQVVEHAQAVLPATLLALEGGTGRAPDAGSEPSEPPEQTEPRDQTEPSSRDDALAPPVDLQARRLLVAGLRPLRDSPEPPRP